MIESVFNLVQYGLIGLASFLFIGWLGFRIPSRAARPTSFHNRKAVIHLIPTPDNLPLPVARYLNTLFPDGIPSFEPIIAWGSGRISAHLRIFGNVWLPLNWSLYLKPGKAYLWRVNITWFMRPFLRGGDLYLDGHGLYRMGKDDTESIFINLSQFTVLWLYTIIFTPNSLASIPDIKWIHVEDNSVWLTVPGLENTYNDFKLSFNPSTGYLEKIDTKRAASRDGTLMDFQSEVMRLSNQGKSSPFLLSIRNSWETAVFINLVSSGYVSGVDIDEELSKGI